MTYITRHRILATVTATGGATQAFYTNVINGGYLEAIVYKRGTTGTTTSGISTAAHITVQTDQSSNVMLTCTATESRTFYPRFAQQNTSGEAIPYASGVTPAYIPDKFPVAQERVKVEFSSAGTASNGGVRAVIDLYLSGGG